jgi:hypothetical protein
MLRSCRPLPRSQPLLEQYKLRCATLQAIAVQQTETWHTGAAGCPTKQPRVGLTVFVVLLLLPATHLNNRRLRALCRHTRV